MKIISSCTYIILLLILIQWSCIRIPKDILPNPVIPTKQQIEYQEMELIGFIHFTVNTFTDKEWGFGDESPAIFNPTALDANQWAKVASEIGMKQLILTAKHHDGFCLWPSKYTEHSVKNSQWKKGNGDVLKEFEKACRKYNIKMGLYLSPWDRNHAEYETAKYIKYYRNQLEELLTQYGNVSEIWFDGANGGTGYYGGANEERRIDRKTYYNWSETWQLVKRWQPNVLIFSDKGPDICWIGNENGFAGETNWSMINSDDIIIGEAPTHYLNSGDPAGSNWVVGECDVSVRPGWFYHENQDSLVKSSQQLVDIYYKSVGRNGVLLLNIPPDKRGLLNNWDIEALKKFRHILDETFKTNLAKGKKVKVNNYRLNHPKFSPQNIVDEDNDTYWATDDNLFPAELEIDLGEDISFDRIMLQEPIRFGQRIAEFSIEGLIDDQWTPLAKGTTIGYKRLLRLKAVKANKIRINITKSNNIPAISNFGLYKASDLEEMIH